MLLGWFAP